MTDLIERAAVIAAIEVLPSLWSTLDAIDAINAIPAHNAWQPIEAAHEASNHKGGR
jgi:hypothetical protein